MHIFTNMETSRSNQCENNILGHLFKQKNEEVLWMFHYMLVNRLYTNNPWSESTLKNVRNSRHRSQTYIPNKGRLGVFRSVYVTRHTLYAHNFWCAKTYTRHTARYWTGVNGLEKCESVSSYPPISGMVPQEHTELSLGLGSLLVTGPR